MFIDDEILAAKNRRANPYPMLLIVLTTFAACIFTAASAFSAAA